MIFDDDGIILLVVLFGEEWRREKKVWMNCDFCFGF